MARINYQEADEIGGKSRSYFSLQNDGDTARVRFLYEEPDLLDIYAVHEVYIDGKRRYVECINPTGDPKLPACPGCKRDGYPTVKLFIKLLDISDGNKYKVWDRGKKFIPKLVGYMKKYGPLVNRLYDIERHGKPKDTQTSYELYGLDKDDKTLKDFDKTDDLLGTLVLQKNQEDFQALLDGVVTEDDIKPRSRTTDADDVF